MLGGTQNDVNFSCDRMSEVMTTCKEIDQNFCSLTYAGIGEMNCGIDNKLEVLTRSLPWVVRTRTSDYVAMVLSYAQ